MGFNPRVTIAIPTFRRQHLIRDAIASVLSQTYQDFELLIVDNNETDETMNIVSNFTDSRIVYCRNRRQLNVIESWNQCVELSKGSYVHIFSDDDRLRPDFLARSMEAHESYRNLGFTFTHAAKTDIDWNFLQLWGYEFPPPGYLTGRAYCRFSLEHTCCISLAPTVVVNKRVHEAVGIYRAPFAKNTFDFNFYLRAAGRFDTYFIDEILVDYRLHKDQLTQQHWRTEASPTGRLGTYLELLGAISELLESASAVEQEFLRERLRFIANQLSTLLTLVLPAL